MSASDCVMLGSLLVTDASNETDRPISDVLNGAASNSEVLLKVPATFSQLFPLGFALDAGGSVMKLVYRSKLDYTSGQANDGEDFLRLRFLPNGNGDELVQFLKDNCDVKERERNDPNVVDERPLYYQTGVGIQHFVEKLNDAFQCTIKTMSESDACINGVLRVSDIIPELKRTIPFSVESTEAGLGVARDFLKMIMKSQEEGLNLFGEAPTQSSDTSVDLPAYCTKLMTVDPATFTEELAVVPITFPCAHVQCGSATACVILHEDGRHEWGDSNPTAGKTVLALARHMLGTKSFQELVGLATQGDHRKVDQVTGELKNKNHQEIDWYSMMPDNFPVFTFGKAAEERYDGTYTKADLAAALLYMQCRELARFGINVARRRRLTSIVYAGSFVHWPLTQKILQECFIGETLLLPLMGEANVTMHIFPHCAFLTAIGVWHENIKKIAERQ